jgi:hypothetical protein
MKPGAAPTTAEAVPAALPLLGSAAETPPELYFAPQLPGAAFPAEGSVAAPVQPLQSEKPEVLPTWAKELLERSGVTDPAIQTAVFHGKSSGGTNVPQISWTAPGAMGPQQQSKPHAGPAELSFKEHREAEDTSRRSPISDAEIQRTADKVYRIIEERLRRELRRSGR